MGNLNQFSYFHFGTTANDGKNYKDKILKSDAINACKVIERN